MRRWWLDEDGGYLADASIRRRAGGPGDSAPSMGAIFGVQVPGRAGHSEASEAQLREGDRAWGGSVERNREPMDKNRIRGVADQGEQAVDCEALVAKGRAA